MKIINPIVIALLAVTLMIIPGAFAKGAGNGSGESYHGLGVAERTCYDSENACGAMASAGACRLIEDGVPMEIIGMVSEVGIQGQGLQVDTEEGVIISVYGLGPVRYWTDQDVARPTVGEEVIINAVEVIFSDGSTKIVAIDITVSGETIYLRDDSGFPLWRGGNRQAIQKRDCLE
jgi:hypothetical protein